MNKTAENTEKKGLPTNTVVIPDITIPKLGIKMFGTTIYASVFCIVTLIFASFLINEGVWGAIGYQVFNILIYTPVVYLAAWSMGNRERNYVSFGRMKEDKWRGVKVGLFAILPYGICLIMMLLSKAGILFNTLWIVRIFYSPFVVIFNLIVPNVAESGEGAVPIAEISYLRLFLASLLQLYVPVVTGFGYLLGYKAYSIYHHVVFWSQKPEDGKEKKK